MARKPAARNIARHIENPEVLYGVINANRYIPDTLTVEPAHALEVMKTFKAQGAESVARVASEPKTLNKLSKDKRKGVRESFIESNPNITQEHLLEMFERTMKAEDDIRFAIAKRLNSENLLKSVTPHLEARQTTDGAYTEFNFAPGGVGPVFKKHFKEGEAYVKELVDNNILQAFTYISTRNSYGRRFEIESDWWEPGMMTWMAGLLKPEWVWRFTTAVISGGYKLTVDDAEAAADIIKHNPIPNGLRVDYSFGYHMQGQDEDVKNVFDALGGAWHDACQYQRGGIALRMNQVDNNRAGDEVDTKTLGTIPAQQLNKLAEKLWKEGISLCRAGWFNPDAAAIGGILDSNWSLVELQGQVYKKKVSHIALAYLWSHSRSGVIEHELVSWAQGHYDSKPNLENVLAMMSVFDQDLRKVFVELLAASGNYDLITDDMMESVGDDIFKSCPRLMNLLFKEHFKDNVDAWVNALEMTDDWEDSIEDLIVTVCATNDLPMPGEDDDEEETTESRNTGGASGIAQLVQEPTLF